MELNIMEAMRLKAFIQRNINNYSEFYQEFWQKDFKVGKDYQYDFVNQVYAYLFPEKCKDTIYRTFIEYIIDKFPNLSDKQIIEVASGYLPAVSILLTKTLDLNRPITCIDPKAILLDIPGIISKKEEFTENTDLSNNNIIIAHCPCGLLDLIIKKTIQNQQELCVQTCPCGNRMDPFMGSSVFNHYIDELLEELIPMEDNGFEISCDDLESFNITNAPVITVRKRQK